MKPNKSPLAAFLLSFIPGVGHGYLGRPVRAIVYGGGFFGTLLLFMFLIMTNNIYDELAIFLLFVMALFAIINMVDMIITLISSPAPQHHAAWQGYSHGNEAQNSFHAGDVPTGYAAVNAPLNAQQQKEKSRTILLSMIPGLGHMSLGFMQRGITLLISYVGLFIIVVFLASVVSPALLVFLFLLPVIWAYGMFDAIALLQAKQRGENIEDRSIFEQLEGHIASGTKSKVLAIALSVFPGAGHMYLGLQKRGLQLMGGFLLAIFIMDNMRLTLFFFLLPLFWCFAFFDGLQQASRYERQEMSDDPIMKQFVPYQRWFGMALLGFGIYFLLDRFFSQYARNFTEEVFQLYIQFKYMLPTAVASFIMIALGLRLVFGSKERNSRTDGKPLDSGREEGVQ